MYSEELAFAKGLSTQAGKIMKRYFRAEDIDTVWKEDDTPLTKADSAINKMVIDEVKKHYPSHGIIGEEESYKTEREFVWVVDPIDGTIPFTLDIPVSTFSLALVNRSDGQPVVAVVFDPYLDHLYSAVKDGGSYLNDLKLKTSNATSFRRNYFYLSSRSPKDYDAGKCNVVITAAGGKCLNFVSYAYCSAKVAAGQIAASCMSYGSPWDSAAVALLVKEAGGIATDLDGNERRYDEFANGTLLVANKTMHTKLLDLIKKSRL